ncbi:MAG TPA: pyruvate carboxylase, partial [Saprospiraceae bacterium]|nr:pyruvate carboxylase [Saprospiraceae bacterium]
DQVPYEGKPNDQMPPIDLQAAYDFFKERFPEMSEYFNFLSYQMYPTVFEQFYQHKQTYGDVTHLPTTAFFYGLAYNEEIMIEMSKGKSMLIQYLNTNEPDAHGNRLVIFRLNGADRSVVVKDKKAKSEIIANQKVSSPEDIGSPLQGSLSKVLVKEGQEVELNTPLFTIEAMKMESTVTAPYAGIVEKIFLKDRSLVAQDDLVIRLKERK